jgi:predicted CoA-binding protein
MADPQALLRDARVVVLYDWPSDDVPDTLTRAGYDVIVFGGPNPDDVFRHELRDGEVVAHRIGVPPTQADLVYSFRPVDELPGIVTAAAQMGAKAVWRQSGRNDAGERDPRGCATSADESAEARALVEQAGLIYIEDSYVADAVRSVRPNP